MSASALRGIHSSGFALDRPLDGVVDLPPRLRDLMVDARYRAAERVFGSAIARGAEVVLLAGDILSGESGPGSRGPWFLREQFRRLDAHGIRVVWAEEDETIHRWMATHLDLPANVTLLSGDSAIDILLRDKFVRVHSRTATSPLVAPKGTADWNLVIVPGLAIDAGLIRWADYIALAGPLRDSLHPNVFASGDPQGTGFGTTGVHGCLSFTLSRTRPPQGEFIPTDIVRWVEERIRVDAEMTFEALRSRLSHRIREFSSGHSCDAWIGRWILEAGSLHGVRLLGTDTQAALLGDLQQTALDADFPVWPAALAADLDTLPAEQWSAMPEAMAAVLKGCREWSHSPTAAADLAEMLRADLSPAPRALRELDAARIHRMQPRLCAEAVRALAVHGLTALR